MTEELKCKENMYPITGVIYDKKVREVPDTKNKNNGEPYRFHSLILEVKRVHKEKTYITFPEFEAGYGVSFDDWDIGDKVVITFSLDGKKIGDWHKTAVKAHYIKHADIVGSTDKDVSGLSPKQRLAKEKAEKDVFVGAEPLGDEDDVSDLPF